MLQSPCRCISELAGEAQKQYPDRWPTENLNYHHLLFPPCFQSELNFEYLNSSTLNDPPISESLFVSIPSLRNADESLHFDAAPKYKEKFATRRVRSKGEFKTSLMRPYVPGKKKTSKEGSGKFFNEMTKIVGVQPPKKKLTKALSRDRDGVVFNDENQKLMSDKVSPGKQKECIICTLPGCRQINCLFLHTWGKMVVSLNTLFPKEEYVVYNVLNKSLSKPAELQPLSGFTPQSFFEHKYDLDGKEITDDCRVIESMKVSKSELKKFSKMHTKKAHRKKGNKKRTSRMVMNDLKSRGKQLYNDGNKLPASASRKMLEELVDKPCEFDHELYENIDIEFKSKLQTRMNVISEHDAYSENNFYPRITKMQTYVLCGLCDHFGKIAHAINHPASNERTNQLSQNLHISENDLIISSQDYSVSIDKTIFAGSVHGNDMIDNSSNDEDKKHRNDMNDNSSNDDDYLSSYAVVSKLDSLVRFPNKLTPSPFSADNKSSSIDTKHIPKRHLDFDLPKTTQPDSRISMVGVNVIKQFADGIYEGCVTHEWNNSKGSKFYHIKYTDEDEEDFSDKQLELYRKPVKTHPSAKTKQNGKRQRTACSPLQRKSPPTYSNTNNTPKRERSLLLTTSSKKPSTTKSTPISNSFIISNLCVTICDSIKKRKTNLTQESNQSPIKQLNNAYSRKRQPSRPAITDEPSNHLMDNYLEIGDCVDVQHSGTRTNYSKARFTEWTDDRFPFFHPTHSICFPRDYPSNPIDMIVRKDDLEQPLSKWVKTSCLGILNYDNEMIRLRQLDRDESERKRLQVMGTEIQECYNTLTFNSIHDLKQHYAKVTISRTTKTNCGSCFVPVNKDPFSIFYECKCQFVGKNKTVFCQLCFAGGRVFYCEQYSHQEYNRDHFALTQKDELTIKQLPIICWSCRQELVNNISFKCKCTVSKKYVCNHYYCGQCFDNKFPFSDGSTVYFKDDDVNDVCSPDADDSDSDSNLEKIASHNEIKDTLDTKRVKYSKLSVRTVEKTDEKHSVYFLIRVVGRPRNDSTDLFPEISNKTPEQMQQLIKDHLIDRLSFLKVVWSIDDTEVKYYNHGSEPRIYQSER